MKYFTKTAQTGTPYTSIRGSSTVATQAKLKNGTYNTKVLMKVPAGQVGGGGGHRYYQGASNSPELSFSRTQAQLNARQKMATNPADSLTTPQANKMYGLDKQSQVKLTNKDLKAIKEIVRQERIKKITKAIADAYLKPKHMIHKIK